MILYAKIYLALISYTVTCYDFISSFTMSISQTLSFITRGFYKAIQCWSTRRLDSWKNGSQIPRQIHCRLAAILELHTFLALQETKARKRSSVCSGAPSFGEDTFALFIDGFRGTKWLLVEGIWIPRVPRVLLGSKGDPVRTLALALTVRTSHRH